ncbi:hypothetical protein HU200_034812 [Digitaria exilis]|uniref:DUF7378 domain-containing protein n=1 Tax=Digitaria exilis TaxID=1010633 RepID=A0A835BIS0_9POAL|nr:hypothetical protein HU200_034812 [Digitaria exilis]
MEASAVPFQEAKKLKQKQVDDQEDMMPLVFRWVMAAAASSSSSVTIGEDNKTNTWRADGAWVCLVCVPAPATFVGMPAAIAYAMYTRPRLRGDDFLWFTPVALMLLGFYMAVAQTAMFHTALYLPRAPLAAWEALRHVGFDKMVVAVIATSGVALLFHAIYGAQWALIIWCWFVVALVAAVLAFWICLVRIYGDDKPGRSRWVELAIVLARASVFAAVIFAVCIHLLSVPSRLVTIVRRGRGEEPPRGAASACPCSWKNRSIMASAVREAKNLTTNKQVDEDDSFPVGNGGVVVFVLKKNMCRAAVWVTLVYLPATIVASFAGLAIALPLSSLLAAAALTAAFIYLAQTRQSQKAMTAAARMATRQAMATKTHVQVHVAQHRRHHRRHDSPHEYGPRPPWSAGDEVGQVRGCTASWRTPPSLPPPSVEPAPAGKLALPYACSMLLAGVHFTSSTTARRRRRRVMDFAPGRSNNHHHAPRSLIENR